MLCLVGGQGAGKSTFFRLMAVRDEWFSDDLRKLSGPSNIAMLLDSFRILPYLSNRYADIHVDVSSIGQKKFYFFLPKTI